jgi:lysophospholipase
MRDAPYFGDLADGPDGAAYWLTAADGVRLRVAAWRGGDRGTVLLFPGRTEYVEKYGRAASDFLKRGYSTVAIDWRGQGLADRLVPNPLVGYVRRFTEYQHDVAALMAALPALNLPLPLHVLAHSMGGCIALRALINGMPVRSAAFSAPMWDINLPRRMRPVARIVGAASRPFGFSKRFVPGTSLQKTYVDAADFTGNELTTDADMYAYMRAQVAARVELALGGPSIGWVGAALREVAALSRHPSPALPVITFLGSEERIVCSTAIARRMARWPGGRLVEVPGARHEVMMETPDTRARFFDETSAFFAAAQDVAQPGPEAA